MILKELFGEETELEGYSIPLVQLTDEEYSRDITLDRIIDHCCTVGEDFFDSHCTIINFELFAGFLIAKLPNKAKEILEIVNKSSDLNDLSLIFESDYKDRDYTWIYEAQNKIYELFCELVNYTTHTKAKVNQILIQIDNYYNQ
jgi:hypothetical protein